MPKWASEGRAAAGAAAVRGIAITGHNDREPGPEDAKPSEDRVFVVGAALDKRDLSTTNPKFRLSKRRTWWAAKPCAGE